MTVYRVGRRWTASDEETLLERNKRIAELEAELAGHKARLAAINIYGDADIAAFKWQARAEKAEAELAEVRTVADASERNHATQFDRVVAEKHDLEAEVERLRPYEAHVRSHDDVCCRCVYEGGGRESGGAGKLTEPAHEGSTPSAAANSAAPCSICGWNSPSSAVLPTPHELSLHEHIRYLEETAARKERSLRLGSPSVNETGEK